jgi:hypothetical protein
MERQVRPLPENGCERRHTGQMDFHADPKGLRNHVRVARSLDSRRGRLVCGLFHFGAALFTPTTSVDSRRPVPQKKKRPEARGGGWGRQFARTMPGAGTILRTLRPARVPTGSLAAQVRPPQLALAQERPSRGDVRISVCGANCAIHPEPPIVGRAVGGGLVLVRPPQLAASFTFNAVLPHPSTRCSFSPFQSTRD